MKELSHGIYGLWIYLPLSGLARKWRRFSRKLRGKPKKLLQQITLPPISWRKCINGRAVKIREYDKANGNIRISELAVLSLIALEADDNTNLFEIGTFDGRTSLNLAFSSPDTCKIYTLDLKPEMDTEHALANGERHMVEKKCRAQGLRNIEKRINLLLIKYINYLATQRSLIFHLIMTHALSYLLMVHILMIMP